jgi:hypothetical protein
MFLDKPEYPADQDDDENDGSVHGVMDKQRENSGEDKDKRDRVVELTKEQSKWPGPASGLNYSVGTLGRAEARLFDAQPVLSGSEASI